MTAPFAMPDTSLRPSVRSLVRACAGAALFACGGIPKRKTDEWRADAGAWYLLRGAVPPALTTDAEALVRTVVSDLISTLAPQSVAAKIFARGLQLTFGQAGQISVPTLLGDPSLASFVAEGWPIPVVQSALVEPLVTLVPTKLACIVVLTTEMVQSSNVEALVLDALTRSAALALDSALLDANPASSARPPGLRYGIAAIAADSSPEPLSALVNDIGALYAAVAATAARAPVYVMSSSRAFSTRYLLPPGWAPADSLGSFALHGTTDMIAMAPNAIASAYGSNVEISASRESALQMETAPTDLATGPTRSTWQTDCVAIRLKLPVAWALRTPRAVSWLTATNW
jgi:hypothetical protein